jgi:hypothetical protein
MCLNRRKDSASGDQRDDEKISTVHNRETNKTCIPYTKVQKEVFIEERFREF